MEVLHLTKNDFDGTISSGTVLVDFWASWCGHCKVLAPVIDTVAAEAGEGVKVAKVDVDAESELAQRYGVMAVPTVIVFKNGQPVQRLTGAKPKEAYLEALLSE